MPLLVLGLNHRSAPVEIRERFACPEAAVPAALAALRQAGLAAEAVLVSTCNRVEWYLGVEGDAWAAARRLREQLLADRGLGGEFSELGYTHVGVAGLEHLFRVAAGLDSLVLGETEILGQLKKAYDLALREGHTARELNQAFQRAFSVAKEIRTQTQIQRGNTSVASVAVELAEKIFDDLGHRQVLVIGAGDTSEKTARALLSRGARSVIVSNRSFDRAAALAEELGGRAIHFDEWEREFPRIDIIISSTSAPHHVLDRLQLERLLKHRSARPLLLVDLAVPRDIDPEVEKLDDVFLYNVDHLQSVADEYSRQRRDEVARCEEIIRARAAAHTAGRPGRPGPFPAASPSR
jgi:glutamyl-tRNA reductase